MNPLETFGEFSTKVTPKDLMLYAGAGLVLWVIFKDQLSPVQKLLLNLVNSVKSKTTSKTVSAPVAVSNPVVKDQGTTEDSGVFFDLIVSWKQTRDLAVKSGCSKAVAVADQMFPYLSPVVCAAKKEEDNEQA
jgi:hypothetical protein